MEQSKETGNCIIFICNNNHHLIEYNIVTKKRYVHYSTSQNIRNFCISRLNKIIAMDDNSKCVLDWNGKVITLPPSCFGHLNLFFGIQTSDTFITLINTTHHYVSVASDIYMTQNNGFLHISSCDNYEGMIYYNSSTNTVCYKNVRNMRAYDIFLDEKFVIDKCKCLTLSWMRGSNRLVVISTCNGDKIYNVETKRFGILLERQNLIYYDTGGKIFFGTNLDTLEIYDVASFRLLTKITIDFNICLYHKKLNLIVTTNLQYYRIINMQLKKVKVGENYINDRNYIPNVIMDVLLCLYSESVILFEMIPIEILCTYLYCKILSN